MNKPTSNLLCHTKAHRANHGVAQSVPKAKATIRKKKLNNWISSINWKYHEDQNSGINTTIYLFELSHVIVK